MLLLFIIAGFVIVCDQLSKFLVRQFLLQGQSLALVKGVFHITLIKNPGASFGIFPNKAPLFLIFSIAIIIGIIIYSIVSRPRQRGAQIALGLALGGATGNLIDRLMFGKITDFLDFKVWPVFNIADTAVVVGLFMILSFILWGGTEKEKEKN